MKSRIKIVLGNKGDQLRYEGEYSQCIHTTHTCMQFKNTSKRKEKWKNIKLNLHTQQGFCFPEDKDLGPCYGFILNKIYLALKSISQSIHQLIDQLINQSS